MTAFIRVSGARVHNLKNIHVSIPRDRFVVVTGLSGSGKSSLAFDTIFAEGQRRYIESLSAYARQFLEVMEKPDVDAIEGLSPTISIDQKSASHNPRSTVGTVTEIHDYLRLLFARVGQPHCPRHDLALRAQSAEQIVEFLLARKDGRRVAVLAPLVVGRKGEYVELFANLAGRGFARARVDGEIYAIEEVPTLAKTIKHTIEAVVDRVRVAADSRRRLLESIETAAPLGDGRIRVFDFEDGEMREFSTRHACPRCGYAPPELEPKLFSFNNPQSACGRCGGLGHVQVFDPDLIVEHPALSIAAGAIRGWDSRNEYAFAILGALAAKHGIDLQKPFARLPKKHRHLVLFGDDGEIEIADGGKRRKIKFDGVVAAVERRWRETDSPYLREELGRYQITRACADCGGARLSPAALAVKIDGRSIHQYAEMPLVEFQTALAAMRLTPMQAKIAERVAREISERVRFLINVGLDYLSLSRAANTLSGGEAQRIRLAGQVGSGLTGVTYVLDEPSIGLHPEDNGRLLETLRRLRDLGNTVIVVEHDEEAIRAADYVVDLGPRAGAHGGEIVACGPPAKVLRSRRSLTADYLSGRRRIEIPTKRRRPEHALVVRGARGNNLKSIDARFPLGALTCVTGVSGSGKSTLVNSILTRAAWRHFHGGGEEPLAHDAIDGLERLDKIALVDQSSIGRTPRSNPATYTGLFTPIRELFASTPEARERGYAPGRFSFNVAGGRCETCQGGGSVRVEMHFLPDVFVTCDACGGRRYGRETLEVRWRGKNIQDILETTIREGADFFANIPAVSRRLRTLCDVGLGYVRLGQSAMTLSGGEAQRVKLAVELSRRDSGQTMYVLDEPTTGLHFHDVEMLLSVLRRLVDNGNTVVVIEHNLDVIKTADWIIDLGPRGGAEGGRVMAAGAPEDIARAGDECLTGKHLRRILDGGKTLRTAATIRAAATTRAAAAGK